MGNHLLSNEHDGRIKKEAINLFFSTSECENINSEEIFDFFKEHENLKNRELTEKFQEKFQDCCLIEDYEGELLVTIMERVFDMRAVILNIVSDIILERETHK